MTYTSLESSDKAQYPYSLRIAHLYGNLMNTYGDNGNILMLKYVAEKLGAHVTVDIVSIKDLFDPDAYDIAFFGGGQDYEQTIVSEDLPDKKEDLERFIHDDGVVLAICGGFQLLGQYYIEASCKRIEGLGIMGHYTLNQVNNRYIGDIKTITKNLTKPIMVLKTTKVGPSWLRMKNRWVRSSMEMGTTKKMGAKGFITRTSLAATSTVLSCPEMPIWPID